MIPGMNRDRTMPKKPCANNPDQDTVIMNASDRKKPTLESNEIFPGVFQITHNRYVYSWLVRGREQSLLIDTGYGLTDLKTLAESLAGNEIIVVNTHGHYDHTYGNFQFDRVHLSREDLPLAIKSYGMDIRLEKIKDFDTSDLPSGMSVMDWMDAPHPETSPLDAGVSFDLGGRTIETIPTPGHTAGSVCFLDPAGRILFSGDTIYRGYLLLHFESSTELPVYRDSLARICSRKKEFDWILPAHGRTPLKADFAEGILEGVEKIISGKRPGEKHTFRGRKCLISSFDDFFIVYKDPD